MEYTLERVFINADQFTPIYVDCDGFIYQANDISYWYGKNDKKIMLGADENDSKPQKYGKYIIWTRYIVSTKLSQFQILNVDIGNVMNTGITITSKHHPRHIERAYKITHIFGKPVIQIETDACDSAQRSFCLFSMDNYKPLIAGAELLAQNDRFLIVKSWVKPVIINGMICEKGIKLEVYDVNFTKIHTKNKSEGECIVGFFGRYILLDDSLFEITQNKLERKKECAICFNKPKPAGLLMPCLHREFCYNCVKSLTECPLCRAKITNVVNI